mmetsp:Transcript_18085/g.43663  ORF Transcript_18085/g.43663 Transcript_18085/m.43663 type:complete len:87 (+) Transcript_18085:253-513(+)
MGDTTRSLEASSCSARRRRAGQHVLYDLLARASGPPIRSERASVRHGMMMRHLHVISLLRLALSKTLSASLWPRQRPRLLQDAESE